jgi:replicative DNA helicase
MNEFQYLLPQNIDAEEALLGALLIDPEAIYKVVDLLHYEDFYKPNHQIIYKAMLDIFERREPIDIVSITNELKNKRVLEEIGGAGYLLGLINKTPSIYNIVNYGKIVREKKARRDLISLSTEIQKTAFEEQKGAEELIDEVESRIFRVAERVYPLEFQHISALIEGAAERIDELHKQEKKLRGLPTGLPLLDEYLGGLQKSDLIILASRPSLGKTSLALGLARHLAINEKIPVAIFSLEMSKDQLVDRFIAAEAGVNLWRLRTGKLYFDGDVNELAQISEALDKLSQSKIYIDDTPSLTSLQIRAMTRKLKHQVADLGLVIVDYLQLLRSHRFTDNRVQEMTEISRGLKDLSRELNIPVLAISQLSRAPEQRISQVPKLSDLRDSGCLSGDTVILNAETGEHISIKELSDKKLLMKVLTLDNDGQIAIKSLIRAFPSGEKMIYLLKTKTGRTIKASANHPFKIISGWIALENLRIGDRIALPQSIDLSISQLSISAEELIFLAHMLGDGCFVEKQPIHYTSSDWDSISLMNRLAKRIFNIQSKIVKQENWWHIYFSSPYHLSRNKHHPIINWLRNLGLDFARSYQKILPAVIFQLPKEKIALFLHHLWSTDGNISVKKLEGRKPSAQIYYPTTSEILARGVQHLLLRLGIQSYLKQSRKQNYKINYNIIVYGKENILKFLDLVGCFGMKSRVIPELITFVSAIKPHFNNDLFDKNIWQEIINPLRIRAGISWRRFANKMQTAYNGSALTGSNLSRERLSSIATISESNELKKIADSQIFWDEIVSIKQLKIEPVYDATVEGTHNFLANDIFVHNSIEQDADVVIFIHRPRETGQNVPANQADIIIAKHRNGPLGVINLYFDPDSVAFYSLETEMQEIELH